MKPYLLLLISLFLIACGPPKEKKQLDSNVGETRLLEADDNFTQSEKANLKTACEALKIKSTYMKRVLLTSTSSINYTTQSKDCEKDVSNAAEMGKQFQVIEKNNRLAFSTDGNPLFTEIVESDSVIIESLCNKAQNEEEKISRVMPFGSTAYWYSVYSADDTNCNGATQTDSNIICLKIETGLKQENSNNFDLIESEVFKIETHSSKVIRGFVVDRIHTSNVNCKDKEKIELKKQTFQSL